jgi:hypothetical protein
VIETLPEGKPRAEIGKLLSSILVENNKGNRSGILALMREMIRKVEEYEINSRT